MFKDTIVALTKMLYPKGRAFKMPEGGYFEGLTLGLAESENKAYSNALSILDSALPDNDNFTADDATDWEIRLGMIVSPNGLLVDRKEAIKRKMAFPGNIKARQHRLYVQGQLRAAGFDVYVYENKFDDGGGAYSTRLPSQISGFTHGQYAHGQYAHGGLSPNKCVNHIDESLDNLFVIGSNLLSTFYIGSVNIGTPNGKGVNFGSLPLSTPSDAFASVPLNRKDEFRKLLLTLKPAQTVGLLYVNYI